MIADPFHRGAGIAHRIGVRLVFPQIRIVRSDCNVATLGQLMRVMQIRSTTKTNRLPFPEVYSLVQANHSREAPFGLVWDEEVSRHPVPFFRDKSQFLACVSSQTDFFEYNDIQRHFFAFRQRAHDQLHVGQDVTFPLLPIGSSADRMPYSVTVQVIK